MSRRGSCGRLTTLAAAALLVPLFIVTLASPSIGSSTLTGPAFLERLERARELAELGESQPGPSAMDAVRDAVGLPVELTLPGGTTYLGPDPFLGSLAGDKPEDFRRAREHLLALAAEVRVAQAASPLDRTAVGQDLARAYAGISRPGPLQTFAASVRALLARLLQAALELLSTYQGVGSAVAWAVVLGIAALVVLVLRRLGLGLVPERAALARGMASGPVDWRGLADEALRRGDLREATRALYHALVATLTARGVIFGDPSMTAGECRSAVARTLPAIYPAVLEATSAFERVAYGGDAPRPVDIEALRAANREAAA